MHSQQDSPAIYYLRRSLKCGGCSPFIWCKLSLRLFRIHFSLRMAITTSEAKLFLECLAVCALQQKDMGAEIRGQILLLGGATETPRIGNSL